MDELKAWVAMAAAIAALGSTLWQWISAPGRHAEVKVDSLRVELGGRLQTMQEAAGRLDERIGRIESELKHLPDKDTVYELKENLADLRGEMRAMLERVTAVAKTSSRLEDWLLQQGK